MEVEEVEVEDCDYGVVKAMLYLSCFAIFVIFFVDSYFVEFYSYANS